MDSQPVSDSEEFSPPTKLSARERYYKNLSRVLIRSFLEGGECVDVDADVVKELLQGMSDDESDEELADIERDGDEEQDERPEDGTPETEDPNNDPEEEEEEEENDEVFERELDAQFTQEREQVLSEISREQLILDIKERGQAYVINEYAVTRQIPVWKLLVAFNVCLTPELRSKSLKTQIFFLRVAMYQILQRRTRLPYSTIDDAVDLIRNSRNILILSGAGISVSCGIPDFRSRTGIYSMLQEKGEYDLDDPQQMFDIDYFKENPAGLTFRSQIYPSNFIPSPSHRFIKLIENKGKLLRNYTQNIDTLETQAGVRKVVQCHGSFATASCINCHVKVPGNAIEAEIMARTIPLCKSCTTAPTIKVKKKGKKKKKNYLPWESDGEEEPDVPAFPSGVMKVRHWKPDITFFGEKLSDEFDKALAEDRPLVDLMIIIGTSLKVSPVADIPTHLRHSVPQIVINKTPILHLNADIVLLGNADDVVQCLCRKLQWDLPELLPRVSSSSQGTQPERPNLRKRSSATLEQEPQRVGNSHVWLFEGAEPGDIDSVIEERYGGQPGPVEGEDEDDSESDSVKHRFKKARMK
ncbi:SIR2-domain-containing protein [Irpex rosettiformis]|uniref:SIR2-domain-containing protein n=1 Tax=Irpex rosettiformis TaxID=378272 RepID=A0ACB8TPK9_9APHY|nr:SIR2-domain-containing protein [Irpex rosettiformis]